MPRSEQVADSETIGRKLMNGTHYIGFDLHKKTISYCAKGLDGTVHDEGVIEATRSTIRDWAAHREQKWIGAMEATLFTGWIYDELKPHAVELKVAHPAMLKAIGASKKKNDRVVHKRFRIYC